MSIDRGIPRDLAEMTARFGVVLTLATTPLALAEEAPTPLPAAQNASGTSWLPLSTPLPGLHAQRGAWGLMLHYDVAAGLSVQDAPENDTEGVTTSWLMGMAQWESTGMLTLRGMLSFEAPFLGRDGYPLTLQTGETANGQPLVDRQHPHDLFMELALKYDLPLSDGCGFEVYVAPVGEPALGPTAFPHRTSAATDPLAPLGHHWEDSTHVSFGVLTSGFYWRRVKVEGSWFNGREPDEHRYNFDFAPLDSYSARVTVNPSDDWSVQGSYGHLSEPEELEPGIDQNRATASVTYNRPRMDGNWASTFVWGRTSQDGERASHALLLESSFTFGPHAIFGRAEYVQKAGHEFGFTGGDAGELFPVGALVGGYSHRIARFSGAELAAGARASIGFVGDTLALRYDTSHPLAGVVFLQLHPAGGGEEHHHHGM